MTKLFDLRTAGEQQTSPAVDNSIVEQIKANRHLLGPFKPGTVVQQVGDGFRAAHIPNSAEQMTDEQKAIVKESQVTDTTPMPQPDTPVRIPKPVSFESLPEEKKQTILHANEIAAAKLQQAGLGKPEQVVQSSPPAQATAPQKLQSPKTVPEQPSKNAGLPPDIAGGPDIGAFMNSIRQRQVAQEQEESKSSDTDNSVPSAGGVQERTNCQHCGWDLSKADPEAPDELDKLNFIQSILGQIPFKKSYDLLGGRVQVVFRTLSSAESDMAFTQIAYDVGKGAVLDEGQYFRTITDYRMCLGLSLFKSDSESIELPNGVEEWKTDTVPAKATKLIHIVPAVYERVIRSEPIRRGVATCFFRFQRLVEKMEAHFDDPNFWPAIEKQP